MNVRMLLALVFTFTFGLSGAYLPVGAQTYSDQTVTEVSDEEYAVYSAAIAKFFSVRTSLQQVVVKQRTTIEWSRKERVQYIRQQIPELDQTLTKRFKQRNKTPEMLEPRFSTQIPVKLISQQELDDIFKEGANSWRIFYERYPNSQGLMDFSRVGFNTDRTQALVYVGNLAGFLAGEGRYLFLVKENGVWTPKKEITAWVS